MAEKVLMHSKVMPVHERNTASRVMLYGFVQNNVTETMVEQILTEEEALELAEQILTTVRQVRNANSRKEL